MHARIQQRLPEAGIQSVEQALLTIERVSLWAFHNMREETMQRVRAVAKGNKILPIVTGDVLQVVQEIALVQLLTVCEHGGRQVGGTRMSTYWFVLELMYTDMLEYNVSHRYTTFVPSPGTPATRHTCAKK